MASDFTDIFIDIAITEVERVFDHWMLGDTCVAPVPNKVHFTNHSIAPLTRIPMTAARYIKSFQGHQFAVGRSKK